MAQCTYPPTVYVEQPFLKIPFPSPLIDNKCYLRLSSCQYHHGRMDTVFEMITLILYSLVGVIVYCAYILYSSATNSKKTAIVSARRVLVAAHAIIMSKTV